MLPMTMPAIAPAPIAGDEELGCEVWEEAGVVVLEVADVILVDADVEAVAEAVAADEMIPLGPRLFPYAPQSGFGASGQLSS